MNLGIVVSVKSPVLEAGISNIGGPTDRIAWFLNLIIGQLLRHIPAHLPNTSAFLQKLQSCRLEEGCVMESFDVTALYTNVSNNQALQAVSEMMTQHQAVMNLYGLSVSQVMTLLNECLQCNVFRWSGEYYKHVRGLAMGQRLAPVLAVTFMSKVESPVLQRMPTLYYRYIDDCFVVCPTQKDMDDCFAILNEHVAVSILARETEIAARRTLEALWIAARSPRINRKDECVAVTQELAPFVDMCGLDLPGHAPEVL
ncbi:unnamed protein product [Nippostrongylus brasiliensis]|uniref:Reverse transcriptase domain-containing protein n=1 Tax=Nippostrongylus brasiliensis TaxID=27835 RepID=A0A0N4Y1V5_NIPBR|nr:unnamed protein product [Nippostrongylus brasiliensis]